MFPDSVKTSLLFLYLALPAAVIVGLTIPAASKGSLFTKNQGDVPQTLVKKPFPAIPEQAQLQPPEYDSEKLRGSVSISTYDRKISVTWSNDDPDGNREYFLNSYSVAYWPTAAYGEGDVLYVAGKNPSSGNTLVEKWTFSFSQLPSVQPPLIAKATLVNGDVVGQKTVRLMEGLHANGEVSGAGILVQFDDSRDFYSLDKQTGSLTLLVASYAYPGLDALDLVRIFSGEHPESGYVYIMTEHWGVKIPPTEVVFIDKDKDGEIDSVHLVNSDNAWDTLDIDVTEWTTAFP